MPRQVYVRVPVPAVTGAHQGPPYAIVNAKGNLNWGECTHLIGRFLEAPSINCANDKRQEGADSHTVSLPTLACPQLIMPEKFIFALFSLDRQGGAMSGYCFPVLCPLSAYFPKLCLQWTLLKKNLCALQLRRGQQAKKRPSGQA